MTSSTVCTPAVLPPSSETVPPIAALADRCVDLPPDIRVLVEAHWSELLEEPEQ